MRILLVAADRMELRGILERAEGVRQEALAVDFARRARVGSHEILAVANGVGRRRAAAAVAAADGFEAEAVVSTGFCGATDARIGIAEVVAASVVRGAGREYPCTSVPAPHSGAIASIDRVARTAAEKRALWTDGACAVEMEAAGVAEAAGLRGAKFYCIRSVTDLADEDMANDFNRALRADGHFDTMIILRGALRSPSVRVPELLRLRSRCLRAAQSLGDFIVGCRF